MPKATTKQTVPSEQAESSTPTPSPPEESVEKQPEAPNVQPKHPKRLQFMRPTRVLNISSELLQIGTNQAIIIERLDGTGFNLYSVDERVKVWSRIGWANVAEVRYEDESPSVEPG